MGLADLLRQYRIDRLTAKMEKIIARSKKRNGYLRIQGGEGWMYGWPRILNVQMTEDDCARYIVLLRRYADLSWSMTAVDRHDYEAVLDKLAHTMWR